MSERVKLKTSDGHQLDAYVARPSGTPLAGLVVIQEIFGVNEHIRAVADRYAQQGFLVVAPALFDRIEKNIEIGYEGDDLQRAYALYGGLDVEASLKDVDAALNYAKDQTGKAALVVGYCYGGSLAWLSATRLAPAAAVGYYGGMIEKFVAEKPRVPVLLHFGRKDTHIPLKVSEEVKKLHPEVQVYLYDAGHAFNREAPGSYVPDAAKLAYARSLAFLKEHAAK